MATQVMDLALTLRGYWASQHRQGTSPNDAG
jgi:hypothetical protein